MTVVQPAPDPIADAYARGENPFDARAGAPVHSNRGKLPPLRTYAAAVLLLGGLSPHLGGLAWPVDLLGNFSSQLAALTMPALAWWLIRRRGRTASVAALALALHAWALIPGRAAWSGDPAGPDRTPLSVLTFNGLANNPTPERVFELLELGPADVVALVEAPQEVVAALPSRGTLRAVYPHITTPSGIYKQVGWQVILSRWPLRPFHADEAPARPGVQAAIVDRPGGPFVMIITQPQSPRSPARWLLGNEIVRHAARTCREARAEGFPVVLGADLNSTPSGWRSRHLIGHTDLARCKPLLRAESTYPADRSWPLGIAIDDIWVSAGARVTSWETLDSAGSDHRPVRVGLSVPVNWK
ncbi:MAG: endonuclease/exonuclease/phosphatase family protein [Phycisphaerae bacterium]|nr:endonuclease/exonuclease/phosphatase family protein [Phycisphaerae bacterium]